MKKVTPRSNRLEQVLCVMHHTEAFAITDRSSWGRFMKTGKVDGGSSSTHYAKGAFFMGDQIFQSGGMIGIFDSKKMSGWILSATGVANLETVYLMKGGYE